MKAAAVFSEVLGHAVMNRRKARKKTQGDLARALAITQSGYSRLERGRASLTVIQLRVAAHALGLEASTLLWDAELGVNLLSKRGVKVLDEEPPEDERGNWVWVGPREIQQAMAAVKPMPEFARGSAPPREGRGAVPLKSNVKRLLDL